MTLLAHHITPTATAFKHDRAQTVGASEIGACARQVWFRKNGVVEERDLDWGFGERGKHVEKWVYDRLKAAGIRLKRKQKTLTSGNLSATLDGMVDGCVVDIKSFDPYKKNVVEHKHLMQVQVQIWLAKAERGVLLYVNASNFQDIREHEVERDAAAFLAASQRADWIMETKIPPPREGHIAGGNECRMCPYQTECLGAPIEGGGKLNESDTTAVAAARLMIRQSEAARDDAEGRIAVQKEIIREILRAADARRAPGLARISRSQRSTVDHDAMQRDGIDVAKYRKSGRETETVTVE